MFDGNRIDEVNENRGDEVSRNRIDEVDDEENIIWLLKGYEIGFDRAIELIGKYGPEDARNCVLILRKADRLLE